MIGKIIILELIFFLSFIIYSCSDNPVSDTVNYNLITSFNGTIHGLPSLPSTVKAVLNNNTLVYTVDSDSINNDSSMNIDLTIPPEQYLIDIDQFLTSAGGTTYITDHEAKVNTLSLELYDSSDRNTGFVYRDNHNSSYELFPGFVNVSLLYSDRSFSVTGRSIEVSGSDTTIMAYNAFLGKGWNVVTVRVKDIRKGFIEFEFFNGEYGPAGADWHYYSFITDNTKYINLFRKFFKK